MRIFNASPLILLFEEIGEPDIIELLSKIDNKLLVPERVRDEIKSKNAKINLENLVNKGYLFYCKNGKKDIFDYLKNRFPMLDDGELTVMSLAYEYGKDCFVIIDESLGRSVSEKLGLNLKGIFGILLELYDKREITKSRLINTCRKIDKSSFRIDFKEIGYEWLIK